MTRPITPHDPVMADVDAFRLTDEEEQRLPDPAVDGVILFRRNFENMAQLKELVREIKAVRMPELVVAVDHGDGRVQRFIDGFTCLPAMNMLGQTWDKRGPAAAKAQAEQVGWVLAAEPSVCGIDLSFTPVLDLDWGQRAVIGNRSFRHSAETVAELVPTLQRGLNRGGMKSCGKHSPGHGFIEGDSHHVLPQDDHSMAELEATGVVPFRRMSATGMAAVIPTHAVCPQVDGNLTGFSARRLRDILCRDIDPKGVIFSDDLTMGDVCDAGGIKERIRISFDAGYDIVLACDRPDLVDELRGGSDMPDDAELAARWQHMANTLGADEAEETMRTEAFRAAQKAIARLASPRDTGDGVKVGEALWRSPSDFVTAEPPSKPQTV